MNMPEFDIDEMLLEDANSEPGTPFRYGKIFSVNYNSLFKPLGSFPFY